MCTQINLLTTSMLLDYVNDYSFKMSSFLHILTVTMEHADQPADEMKLLLEFCWEFLVHCFGYGHGSAASSTPGDA